MGWGRSSVGRALKSHSRGRGFDPHRLHQPARLASHHAGPLPARQHTMPTETYEGLTVLGRPARLPASPEEARLDAVPNPHAGTLYLVRFTAPEFTCLCPVTGQPDFAHLVIDYVPGERLVESKSLKLFLGSFRNHGGFHEACTLEIASGSRPRSRLRGCASAATGTRGAASRSTSSASPARRPRACGCPTRACRPTAAAANPLRRARRRPSGRIGTVPAEVDCAREGEHARSGARGWTSGLGCAAWAWSTTRRRSATMMSRRPARADGRGPARDRRRLGRPPAATARRDRGPSAATPRRRRPAPAPRTPAAEAGPSGASSR